MLGAIKLIGKKIWKGKGNNTDALVYAWELPLFSFLSFHSYRD
jgi:hypothetical protein